jgi:hypothetical protein
MRGATSARLAPAGCAARISSKEATFLFPEIPEQRWKVGQDGRAVEYYWEVSWFPTDQEGGLPWRELSLVVRQDSSSVPAEISLKELVARASLEVVNDSTREVGDGIITLDTEPGFQAGTQTNRVLFSLRGGKTVDRYFRARPDSVKFEIHLVNDERTCTTRVQYL